MTISPPETDTQTCDQYVIVTLGLIKPIRTWSPSKKKYYDKTTAVFNYVFNNSDPENAEIQGEVVMEAIRQECRDAIKAHRNDNDPLRYIRVDFKAPHNTTYQWSPKNGWKQN